MSAWAKPGVKCVCIDSVWPPSAWHGWETIPAEGVAYTIREVKCHVTGEVGILLEEIVNPHGDYADGMREAFWALRRFRPLITRTQEQDLSLFTHLLDGQPIGETA